VSRHFRHSAIYIRTDRNIRGPTDLRGKLVGLPEYQQTANVWMRGIFKEELNLDPSEINWRTGGQEEPGRDERTPLKLGRNIDLQPIEPGKTLNKMLIAGELDAVFSARELSAFVQRAPNVGLLFPNYREVELAYYKRSGMFPIMHLVGIKKTLVEKYPWLPGSVYKAFVQAKRIAINELKEMSATKVTLPWPEMYLQDAVDFMGEDFWRYGVAENARDIETLARYSFEQGLATRNLSAEEIFHPSVFEISKV
jgi:4,5-dihydroxyphthalate decarboxylase